MKFVNKYSGGGDVVKKEPIKIKGDLSKKKEEIEEDLSKREASFLSEFHKKIAGGDRGLRDIPKKKEEIEEKTVVKKESFNTAFGNARKAGLKVFEWNGKKYETELAKKVKDKTGGAPMRPSDEKYKPKEFETPERYTPTPKKEKPARNTPEKEINYGQGRNPKSQESEAKTKSESKSAKTAKSTKLDAVSRDIDKVKFDGTDRWSATFGGEKYYAPNKERAKEFARKVDKVIADDKYNKENKKAKDQSLSNSRAFTRK